MHHFFYAPRFIFAISRLQPFQAMRILRCFPPDFIGGSPMLPAATVTVQLSA